MKLQVRGEEIELASLCLKLCSLRGYEMSLSYLIEDLRTQL